MERVPRRKTPARLGSAPESWRVTGEPGATVPAAAKIKKPLSEILTLHQGPDT